MAQIEAVALLIGSGLMAVALRRGGFAPLDIYSASVASHRSLTVFITAGYFLIVGVLAQIVAALGGASNFPAQAFLVLLALVGILVLILSDRLREGLRRTTSRWFHRPLHDFRRVWTQFSAKLGMELTPGWLHQDC